MSERDDLRFAYWLRNERSVIGEDVDLGALHKQYTEDGDLEERALQATLGATFTPASDPTDAAMITIGGVEVKAWIDDDGTLKVSLNYDQADLETFPEWEDEVPVKVFGIDPNHVAS